MQKNNYFALTTVQQRTILEQTAIKKALPKQAIEIVEKDLLRKGFPATRTVLC